MLAEVLASEEFVKAQRMRHLLQFIVEARLADREHELSQYALGIAAFGRDEATYHAGEDPIVRVQMGRLRERLRTYYAGAGRGGQYRFVIPLGKYLPEIEALAGPAGLCAQRRRLTLTPLVCMSERAPDISFAQGLNEQLTHQMYSVLGDRFVAQCAQGAAPSHAIEGSIRRDEERTRVLIRAIEIGAGAIAWSGQFDAEAGQAIRLQEQLAESICASVMHHVTRAERSGNSGW
ncbi:hypothetical protein HF313_19435 [Massilia atriviolacea]|uniref:Uncharacterized protein n=1 Tax=Massilia atriviolacea TaxID=2495579 RepID=A0A430HSP7_9BURK|nr:hypothetical protein [Massilia atriviolacea]RSZ60522.1 hypothetical protein EJB06_05265 [Massilia atriviolacea]